MIKRVALFLLTAILLAALSVKFFPTKEEEKDELLLKPVSFSTLYNWEKDEQKKTLSAYQKSCPKLRTEKEKTICAILAKTPIDTNEQARQFIERYFQVFEIENEKKGLFTGYYVAALKGAWKQGGKYQTPLWKKPKDLISADLSAFSKELKNKKIFGRVEGTRFIPYETRAEINDQKFFKKAEVLLWVDDPVDAFFLEVQGSGRVQMDTGEIVSIGYAGKNGRAYTSIGKAMLEKGLLEKPVTAQKIKAWLKKNPERLHEILNENASKVFFERKKTGAIGAQGVSLTAHRSMAVDPKYIKYGTLLWLETNTRETLLVAQDTGGAIRGKIRGDLFCGFGPRAEEEAGQMQEIGRYFLLLPK